MQRLNQQSSYSATAVSWRHALLLLIMLGSLFAVLVMLRMRNLPAANS